MVVCLAVASNERLEPTEPPLVMPWSLWNRHLKEPACVVGEQRQLILPPPDDGDDGLVVVRIEGCLLRYSAVISGPAIL
ncbi:hypothetical protein SLA2020_510250 [Shorea laevis]